MEAEHDEGEKKPPSIRDKDKKKVEKVVREILEKANLFEMTEKKVRDQASVKFPNFDFSTEPFVSIVRRVVEDFLQQVPKRMAQVKKERIRKTKLMSS